MGRKYLNNYWSGWLRFLNLLNEDYRAARTSNEFSVFLIASACALGWINSVLPDLHICMSPSWSLSEKRMLSFSGNLQGLQGGSWPFLVICQSGTWEHTSIYLHPRLSTLGSASYFCTCRLGACTSSGPTTTPEASCIVIGASSIWTYGHSCSLSHSILCRHHKSFEAPRNSKKWARNCTVQNWNSKGSGMWPHCRMDH